ncbi:MAG: HEAT repeat domain-containing protein [Rhodothermales bacterium]
MDSLSAWAFTPYAVELVTDVALKATIILGAACLVTALLRRASAATRHAIWSLALVGLLLLPALSALLPSWGVRLPAVVQQVLVWEEASSDLRKAPAALESSAFSTADTRQASVVTESGREARLASDDPAGAARLDKEALAPAVPVAAWIVLLWGSGVVVLLGRLFLHLVRIRIIARHAKPPSDERRRAIVRKLAARLGIQRRVMVLCSPEISIAMTWGVWRPVVMLPYEARWWSEARLRVVVLHELAHIKRRDYAFHLVAQAVRALYWFNPLAWLATHRLHVEQERACDDQVLQAGAGACDYAAHLLDIARSLLRRAVPLPGGIAMARRSSLKERVHAILNTRSNRHALSLKASLAATCLGLSLVLPVATVQFCDTLRAPLSAQEFDGTLSLRARLQSDNPDVWQEAALSLAVQGDTQAPASLTGLVQHEDAVVRERAAWALGTRAVPEAATLLLGMLSDEDADVRAQAVRGLGQVEDRNTLAQVEEMLHDPCPDVRAEAVSALENICRCRALGAIPVALADQNARVRVKAAYMLGETIRALRADDSPRAIQALRDQLPVAVESLKDALEDDNPMVRRHAAYALGEAQDGAALDALKSTVHDGAVEVRLEAVRALGKIGGSCATPTLRLALHDESLEVREMAAWALAQIGAS